MNIEKMLAGYLIFIIWAFVLLIAIVLSIFIDNFILRNLLLFPFVYFSISATKYTWKKLITKK